MRAQDYRRCATLLGVLWIASCGGPEYLEDTEEPLASGYSTLQVAEALYVERCLTASGEPGIARAATCDGIDGKQGFTYDFNAKRHWLNAQTAGKGRCLTAAGTRVLLSPCVEGSATQAWTRKTVATLPSALAQYQIGTSCLTLRPDGVASLAPCSGARSQHWYQSNPRSLRTMLLGGPLFEGGIIRDVLPEVATVQASPGTISGSKEKILRWKVHPIAYQPRGLGQQNVGVIITGHDGNDAPRAYASAQIVRDLARPNDFHAEWRVHIGDMTPFPQELVYVGGSITKRPSFNTNTDSAAATVLAMIRRDFALATADNTLVSAPGLSVAEQDMLLTRASRPLSYLLQDIITITATEAAQELPGWSQQAATAMTFAPANGAPGDGNAKPSACASTPKRLSGTGITAAACLADPLTTPAGKACGYQSATLATNTVTCNWVCCPLAL